MAKADQSQVRSNDQTGSRSGSTTCSTVSVIDYKMTLASLLVAEEAIREEPYERLPALAGTLALAAMRFEQLCEEARQLQSTVDKLPKTADGVPVVPGMDLFMRSAACNECGQPIAVQRPRVDAVESDGIVRRHGHSGGWVERASDLYSTREAAEDR